MAMIVQFALFLVCLFVLTDRSRSAHLFTGTVFSLTFLDIH